MSKFDTLQVPVPKSPRKIFRISSDSSIGSVEISDRPSSLQSAVTAANLIDPSHNYDQLWKFSFYIKIAQLLVAVTCAGFYTKGIEVMTDSITTRTLPYVVFFAYMIINSVVILSYIMRQKMQELLIRMFGFLGGILFTVTGAWSLQVWNVYKDVQEIHMEFPVQMLLVVGLLSFLDAALYFLDTVISYHKSLNGIFI